MSYLHAGQIRVQSFYKKSLEKGTEKAQDVLKVQKAHRAKEEIRKTLGSCLVVVRFRFDVP